MNKFQKLATLIFLSVFFAACTILPSKEVFVGDPAKGREVALFSMSLIDTGYRFGGKNPEAGLDCSGMVSYIYGKAAAYKINGSAVDIAKKGVEIEQKQLRSGDLVFFNTRNFSYSHVGIYIGDGRFIHAPSSNGKVRIDQLSNTYYAKRFDVAKRYF